MKLRGQQKQDIISHRAMHDSPFLFYNNSLQVTHTMTDGLRVSVDTCAPEFKRYVAVKI